MTQDSRDLRDPEKLGMALLKIAAGLGVPLSAVDNTMQVERYNANPTTLEKYGRPQDLPPTAF